MLIKSNELNKTKEYPIAFDESIIIEVQAARAGSEIKSAGGIVIGKLEMGEIPKVGEVISVGNAVPDLAVSMLFGKIVLIPNGRIANVPDPRVVAGEIKESDGRQLVSTHWKNIQAIFKAL
ncbi:MAG: hypothetical protein ACRCWQ_10925 [Bacilli bacterium]